MEIRLASGFSSDRILESQMLSRQKCEALANYYLGFNGWSGKVQYHRQEEVEEGKEAEEDREEAGDKEGKGVKRVAGDPLVENLVEVEKGME